MRRGLWIAAILLIAVIVGGIWCEAALEQTARQYISAGWEMLTLAQQGDWQRAGTTLTAYQAEWARKETWLCMLVNHDEVERVSGAMTTLQAGVMCQNVDACVQSGLTLAEAAEAMWRRSSISLANLL